MRCYITIDKDGRPLSFIISNADWPADFDPDANNPQNAVAAEVRDFHFEHPDAKDIVPYDCAHPVGDFCDCAQEIMRYKNYDKSPGVQAFKEKAPIVVKIDGNVIDFDTHDDKNPYEAPAGTVLTLRIETSGVPDDEPLDEMLVHGPNLKPAPKNPKKARHTKRPPHATAMAEAKAKGKPVHPVLGKNRGRNRPDDVPGFTAGAAEMDVTVPAAGWTSAVGVKRSRLVRPFCVWLRGT